MQRFIGFAAALTLPFALTACPGDDAGGNETGNETGDPTEGSAGTADDTGVPGDCADPTDAAAPRIEVPLGIDADATWTCDQIHVLTGITIVSGGTLTIEPGTTILGGAGSALVVDKGARLQAVGTAEQPIVMTSVNVGASPARGDWGGLALLGTAPTNVGEGVAEGFADSPPSYGGSDAGHDCGALQYLRVEWAGNEISPGNELNGITFYACGTATVVDHVQVHMGLDDGIEMFGGAFDAHHLVITGAADDSIDSDQGFRGSLQHVLLHQDPTIGDNCLEWSNQGNDFTAEPLTGPSIANMTCVGSGGGGDKSKGITLKEGTQASVWNSLLTNLTNEGVVLVNQATQTQAEAGAISLEGSHFCGAATFAVDTNEEDPDPAGWTSEGLQAWLVGDGGAATGSDCALPSLEWRAPNVQPPAGSAPDGAGVMLPAGFAATSYAGAVDPNGEDWTREPWISY
jgi:hypothetical protein